MPWLISFILAYMTKFCTQKEPLKGYGAFTTFLKDKNHIIHALSTSSLTFLCLIIDKL